MADLKERMKRGETILGAFSGINDSALSELFGYAGFDFLALDGEHGPVMYDLEDLIRAGAAAGIPTVVRVAGAQRPFILRALEDGAEGVQVPLVDDAAQAAEVVKHAKYWPIGERGLAFSTRATRYGHVPPQEHMERANREVLVVVQIETMASVAQVDEIAAVQGVDVIFVGPTDLSQSMGFPGELNRPELKANVAKVIEAARSRGKFVGTITSNPRDARELKEQGVQFLLIPTTGYIYRSCRRLVEEIREA